MRYFVREESNEFERLTPEIFIAFLFILGFMITTMSILNEEMMFFLVGLMLTFIGIILGFICDSLFPIERSLVFYDDVLKREVRIRKIMKGGIAENV